jgi:cytochrome P450
MLSFPFPAGIRGTAPAEFDELRASAPVSRVALPDGSEVVLVTRYSDVVTVLTDERFSRARAAALPGSGFGRNQYTGLLDLDPPEHATLRAPVDHALRADHVHAWESLLDNAIRDQLDALATVAQPADLVADFTKPLAARVTCQVVGLDAAASAEVAAGVDLVVSGDGTDAERVAARTGLADALAELIAKRRVAPADDIASMVLADQSGHSGLSDDDAGLVLFGLLISGYVGNRNALARHLFALLATEQLAGLGADPALADDAVEELLRWYPSGNDGLLRVVTAPIELSGVTLADGDVVMPLVAAAARDPRVFDRPDELDLGRDRNPHISFGLGAHACPGLHLVRALFTRTLVAIAQAMPGLRLAVPADEVEHTTDLLPLGLRALPVRW